jgi:hypothetical protein
VNDLPPEVTNKLLALVHEGADGTITISDTEAFMRFVKEYGPKYPEIREMVKLDDAAVQKHYEKTGRVPAGIKATRIVERPESNVIDVQVIYGKDDDA